MRHESATTSRRRDRLGDRPSSARRWTVGGVAIGFGFAFAVACRTAPVTHVAQPAPPTDFLFAAGDSTFWVTSGPQGIRVRGSPLLLANYGGRFYELYVADEDHSFYDAVFTTQRIYRRDLLTGDSDAVFRDSTIAAAAHGYAARHPHEAPLGPDDDAAEDPASSVTGEVDIIDVDGPYLSYEYHGSSSAAHSRGSSVDSGTDVAEHDTIRRGVVDLRLAQRATLRNVLGPTAAESAVARGRRAFAATLDSIRSAGAAGDERAGRATAALNAFAFDPLSFTVLAMDRDPAIQFFARGTGSRSGLSLPLAPVRVADAARSPTWWDAERMSLPIGGPDSVTDVWTKPNIVVTARYDTLGGPGLGQGVVLVLRRPTAAVSRDSGRHEWRVGRFPAPTRRIYWLDTPPVDSATRRALVRAFDESALYGEDARSVRLALPFRHARSGRVAFASLARRRSRREHDGRNPSSRSTDRRRPVR